MTGGELDRLIKEKDRAIMEGLLLADELEKLKNEIEAFLDKNIGGASLSALRYRKIKNAVQKLHRDDRGYPVGGIAWIRPWIEIFEQHRGETKVEKNFIVLLILLGAALFVIAMLTRQLIG